MPLSIKLMNDRTEMHAPENPIVTYEVLVDMGEDGTKTIFSSDSYTECLVAIDEMNINDLSRVDLTEDELELVTGLSINIVLTATNIELVTYGNEQSAIAEVQTYKIRKD